MPVTFSVGEVLELIKYGKFTLLGLYGEIPAEDATPITSIPMTKPPAVEAVYHIKPGWLVVTERYNWGETSRPNKVYYEIWNDPGPLEVISENQGFYCGGKIRESNIDNRSTHILSGGKVHIKLWNCSDPPEDVVYSFTVWYYAYLAKYHDKVLKTFRRVPDALDRIIELLERRVG